MLCNIRKNCIISNLCPGICVIGNLYKWGVYSLGFQLCVI